MGLENLLPHSLFNTFHLVYAIKQIFNTEEVILNKRNTMLAVFGHIDFSLYVSSTSVHSQ